MMTVQNAFLRCFNMFILPISHTSFSEYLSKLQCLGLQFIQRVPQLTDLACNTINLHKSKWIISFIIMYMMSVQNTMA